MDEIALLQQQLAAVQQQEAALKLSDHNVIDLLLKLQQLGKVELVHTLSGKQFLTPAQVERELGDCVTLNAGRASLAELQQALNIDRTYVDKYVAKLARRRSGHTSSSSASVYYVINSGEEVVTNWYLDAIMEDTNTLLQESGTVTIGELAQQYDFAVDYMKEVVSARLGSLLQAQERGNVLYTDSFVAAQKAQIRGALTAATRPTFIPDLVRTFGFQDKVVDECIAELLASRVLMGTLRGREYVPFVFLEAQRESMYSFFQQNGYLEHRRAADLQVARPFDFLKKRFPDAIPLNQSVVSAATLLQVEAAIEDAVNEGGFVDATSVVPTGLTVSDIGLLLRKCEALQADKTAARQIRDVYVFSTAFFDACMAKFTEDAAHKATRAAAEQQQAGSKLSKAQSSDSRGAGADLDAGGDMSDDDTGGKRGRKNKRAKGARGGGAADEPAPSKGGSKGGKGKRGKKGGNDDASTPSKRSTDKGSSASISIVPPREEMVTLLTEWFSQLDDYRDDDELLDGLAEYLEPEVDRIYSAALTTALSSIIRGDAASLRDLRKKFEDRFDELLSPLLVLEKGFNKLEMHVDAKDATGMADLKLVEVHVLETAGVELSALVTSFIAESNNLELEGVPLLSLPTIVEDHVDSGGKASAPAIVTSLSEDNKKVLEKSLPAATSSAVVRMWTLATAGRRSLGDFMVHVPVLADALSMPLRKFDRKKERQVIFSNRHALLEQLDRAIEQRQHVDATAVALQLLFQQCTGLPAQFPRAHVSYAPTVLLAVASSVPPEAMARFRELVELVGRSDSEEEQVQAALQDARTLVALKDIGAAS